MGIGSLLFGLCVVLLGVAFPLVAGIGCATVLLMVANALLPNGWYRIPSAFRLLVAASVFIFLPALYLGYPAGLVVAIVSFAIASGCWFLARAYEGSRFVMPVAAVVPALSLGTAALISSLNARDAHGDSTAWVMILVVPMAIAAGAFIGAVFSSRQIQD